MAVLVKVPVTGLQSLPPICGYIKVILTPLYIPTTDVNLDLLFRVL